MSKMIQIRNVPDRLHRTLKARAAEAGMTLSDYLLAEVEGVADRPTREDMRRRLDERSRILSGEASDEAARAVRASR